MKIVCVIPCHERLKVSVESINLLKKYQTLKPITIIVGWSQVEEQIAHMTGSYFIKCPNQYLGNKWQTGIDFARTLKPDALLIVGSDTMLTPKWVEFCASKIAEGADLVGKIDWYLCNLPIDRPVEIIQFKYMTSPAADFPVGGGRVISKKLLNKLDWNLYPRNMRSCLDHNSAMLMKKQNPTINIFNSDKHKVMDIKGPWLTINSFGRIKNSKGSKIEHIENIPREKIPRWLRAYFPGAIQAIKTIVPEIDLSN